MAAGASCPCQARLIKCHTLPRTTLSARRLGSPPAAAAAAGGPAPPAKARARRRGCTRPPGSPSDDDAQAAPGPHTQPRPTRGPGGAPLLRQQLAGRGGNKRGGGWGVGGGGGGGGVGGRRQQPPASSPPPLQPPGRLARRPQTAPAEPIAPAARARPPPSEMARRLRRGAGGGLHACPCTCPALRVCSSCVRASVHVYVQHSGRPERWRGWGGVHDCARCTACMRWGGLAWRLEPLSASRFPPGKTADWVLGERASRVRRQAAPEPRSLLRCVCTWAHEQRVVAAGKQQRLWRAGGPVAAQPRRAARPPALTHQPSNW
jgi:hypothetical protein